ncbi:D-alanyl-D-alanine carboxypeptidase family protein [Thiohalospira sp.]|uniref:D-alanyl-D-alanine carboxypeptidase family protein n=1 Tax=Thiohalospira sp. TaxID=3080549 RepID=UPI00397FA5A2
MQRRTLLKTLPIAAGAAATACQFRETGNGPVDDSADREAGAAQKSEGPAVEAGDADTLESRILIEPNAPPQQVVDRDRYLERIRAFDEDHREDVHLDAAGRERLAKVVARLERVIGFVGYGHFNLLSFDRLLHFAREHETIGAFTEDELAFMEEMFAADARRYGFFGEKVVTELTARFPEDRAWKVAGSGHYILRGEAEGLFRDLRRKVGDELVLTSGIRSVVKQMHLFLAKVVETRGNLSRASRSLAPPGYSYHGIGDFDVGKAGFGERNFTDEFAETELFHRLADLGLVDIRYTDRNPYGVRFEPWHIKVV